MTKQELIARLTTILKLDDAEMAADVPEHVPRLIPDNPSVGQLISLINYDAPMTAVMLLRILVKDFSATDGEVLDIINGFNDLPT